MTARTLSEPAYDLWVKDKLLGELGIRDNGRIRFEIIGGEIVERPLQGLRHVGIVHDIHDEFVRGDFVRPGFPWCAIQTMHVSLTRIRDGYIPDLMVLDDKLWAALPPDRANIMPAELQLVVEVTSESSVDQDRRPGPGRARATKWNGYAREEIPFYLLADRDPHAAKTTLFSEPDPATGEYKASQEWAFGETIVLPEPFGIEIPTEIWQPWTD